MQIRATAAGRMHFPFTGDMEFVGSCLNSIAILMTHFHLNGNSMSYFHLRMKHSSHSAYES